MTVYASNNQPGRVNYGWISESFSIFGRNAGTWILAALIVGVISTIINYTVNPHSYAVLYSLIILHQAPVAPQAQNPILELLASAINITVSSFFYSGLFLMANKAVRNEPYTLADLFSGSPTFLLFLLYSIIFTISLTIGIVACCVGAFFAWILLWPGYAILADGDDVGSALNRSWQGVSADLVNGAGFAFVLFLLFVVSGLFTCGLATFVTGPMTYIIGALIYRDMIQPKPGFVDPTVPGAWPPPPTVTQAPPQFFTPPPAPAAEPVEDKSTEAGDESV